MKIVVIGGGSTYTPELIDGFARLRALLPLDELVLVDPDEHRRELLASLSRRMLSAAGHPARVATSSDPATAAEGADVVLLQLRVGGQAIRERDETWPLDCGCIGQETTGAGGLAKALRTVPVVLDIAERVRSVAPDAWILDFTNPVGIVTRALLDAGHRAIGLCNVAIGFQRDLARMIGVAPDRVLLDSLGLNHLSWETAVRVVDRPGAAGASGEDVLPRLIAERADEIAARTGQPRELIARWGAVPSYYLHYFLQHDAEVERQRREPTRASRVAALEAELLRLYADPALDRRPEQLSGRGGAFYADAAVDLIASLIADRGDEQVVDTRNDGTLPYLPDAAVIETRARITASGAEPLVPAGATRPEFAGLIAHVAAYEGLALEAARRGGRERVVDALLAHPLVGQWDLAERLADRLLAENAAFLGWAA